MLLELLEAPFGNISVVQFGISVLKLIIGRRVWGFEVFADYNCVVAGAIRIVVD